MFKIPPTRLKPGLTSLRWTPQIVKLSSTRLVYRSIHSSLIKQDERSTIKSTSRRQMNGKKETEPPMTRFTIQVRSPNSTSIQEILNKISEECLPKFASASSRQLYEGNYGVVILATPSFAAWLEDDAGFIPEILKSMDLLSSAAVISACVDGLSEAKSQGGSESASASGNEGISILCGPVNVVLPDHDTKGFKDPPESSKAPTTLSSLTFRLAHDARAVLPLSNTLFRTGRHSTLLHTEWTRARGEFIKTRNQIEKGDVQVKGYLGKSKNRRMVNLELPVVRLTPARRIVDGLGNIVRKLDFGEEYSQDVGSASRELEAAVTKYLKTSDGNATVEVWAMVTSPVKDVPPTLYGTDKTQKPMDIGPIAKWRSDIRICRVLSGGGGWGPKEGLLSLDPQTSYAIPSEARFDFSSSTLEEAQSSALGNIVQSGATIQFFAAIHPTNPPQAQTPSRRNILAFGAVPSKADELDSLPKLHDIASEENLSFTWDRFGCVTESGMFLQYREQGEQEWSANTTKIDLPGSVVGRYAISPIDTDPVMASSSTAPTLPS